MKLRSLLMGASALVLLVPLTFVVAGGRSEATASTQETASTAAPVRLQTGGGYFRDSQGRVVILHGVNLNADVYQYPADDSTPFGFTAKDADLLAASGFNFARLAINWGQLVPSRPGDPVTRPASPSTRSPSERSSASRTCWPQGTSTSCWTFTKAALLSGRRGRFPGTRQSGKARPISSSLTVNSPRAAPAVPGTTCSRTRLTQTTQCCPEAAPRSSLSPRFGPHTVRPGDRWQYSSATRTT